MMTLILLLLFTGAISLKLKAYPKLPHEARRTVGEYCFSLEDHDLKKANKERYSC